jgi:PTH1 family peptidyl-tRNA hydrolase
LLPSVIVGLGNPGPDYGETRHNAGFLVLDSLLQQRWPRANCRRRQRAAVYAVQAQGRELLLVKPLTFMNLSGTAVAGILRTAARPAAALLVVCDCIDLPLGRIRLRRSGGSGGHRGLDSIIERLGTDDFARLRVGIGRPEQEAADVCEHVLSTWQPSELELVSRVIGVAAEAVQHVLAAGIEAAMNRYNGRILD